MFLIKPLFAILGCGSSSSGDERDSQSADWTKLLIQGNSDNLDDDYEAYMRSMRDEKCEENKEDVPDVIAALMDEYGAMCTVPSSSPRSTTNSTLATLARSENCRSGQTVRKPTQSVWSTNVTWESEEDDDNESAAIQSISHFNFSPSIANHTKHFFVNNLFFRHFDWLCSSRIWLDSIN